MCGFHLEDVRWGIPQCDCLQKITVHGVHRTNFSRARLEARRSVQRPDESGRSAGDDNDS